MQLKRGTDIPVCDSFCRQDPTYIFSEPRYFITTVPCAGGMMIQSYLTISHTVAVSPPSPALPALALSLIISLKIKAQAPEGPGWAETRQSVWFMPALAENHHSTGTGHGGDATCFTEDLRPHRQECLCYSTSTILCRSTIPKRLFQGSNKFFSGPFMLFVPDKDKGVLATQLDVVRSMLQEDFIMVYGLFEIIGPAKNFS